MNSPEPRTCSDSNRVRIGEWICVGIFGCGLLLLLTASAVTFIYDSHFLGTIIAIWASIIMLAGAVFAVGCILRNPPGSARCFIIIVGTIALPVIWFGVAGQVGKQREAAKRQETLQTLTKLVSDIEAMRTKLGHLPKGESELETQLGHPIPLSGWKERIDYFQSTDERGEHFRIRTTSGGFGWVIFTFDSKEPEKGITTEPF